MGSLEGVLKLGLELVVGGGSLGLLLSSSLGSLLLEGGGLLGLSLLEGLLEESGLSFGPWVELLHLGFVGQWVLLGLVVDSDGGGLGSEFGLNLVRVDDSGEIGAGHHWSVEGPSGFLGRWGSEGTEDAVEGFEGLLGEDEESTEVTTWSELENVKSVDVASFNTWEVSGGLLDGILFVVVDDEWSLSHDISGVSVFSGTSLDLLGSSDLGEVVTNSEVKEGGEHGLGVWEGQVVDDEWEFRNIFDVVTSGHDEWGACGGSDGRCNSGSSLLNINLSVPFSPDLEWSKHSSLSAHVTESGLTSSRGTGT